MSLSLPPCRKFSEQVLIWEPDGSTNEASSNRVSPKVLPPKIILLFTWADAQPRHYLKYIEGYHELYPNAKVILTQATTLRTFFGGQKSAQRVVQDMVHQELIPLCTNDQISQFGILAHVFSNSGGLNYEATISVWHDAFGSDKPLPLKTLILDSMPGGETYKTEFPLWATGVALGMKMPLPKFIKWGLAATIVTVLMVIPQILGIEIMATRGPKALNTPQNVPLKSVRLYIYSTSDALIRYQAVEAHAESARAKGFTNVLQERFDGSAHVSHLRVDPERYWNAVWKAWNVAQGITLPSL
ncbi:hypothetical protein UA08_03246 [Talaromyces atroroseus]|uniref:DUF829 domain protein n=1 Tax=Talaromyces atroroseus TaxID=1441469 RepID=A0A225B296_TALAT|nr:hypothetical protein UA08_03246 [Talaromyces atroroseus]OKL60945.1 hypothetical protein UA08_03246 [Talaromyces atroroseus]